MANLIIPSPWLSSGTCFPLVYPSNMECDERTFICDGFCWWWTKIFAEVTLPLSRFCRLPTYYPYRVPSFHPLEANTCTNFWFLPPTTNPYFQIPEHPVLRIPEV